VEKKKKELHTGTRRTEKGGRPYLLPLRHPKGRSKEKRKKKIPAIVVDPDGKKKREGAKILLYLGEKDRKVIPGKRGEGIADVADGREGKKGQVHHFHRADKQRKRNGLKRYSAETGEEKGGLDSSARGPKTSSRSSAGRGARKKGGGGGGTDFPMSCRC